MRDLTPYGVRIRLPRGAHCLHLLGDAAALPLRSAHATHGPWEPSSPLSGRSPGSQAPVGCVGRLRSDFGGCAAVGAVPRGRAGQTGTDSDPVSGSMGAVHHTKKGDLYGGPYKKPTSMGDSS